MKNKIILSADSTCDLGDQLKQKYNVHYYPFHIISDGKQFQDGVDITPEDIYKIYYKKNSLPKTAAIGSGEYTEYFKPFVKQGFKVVHLNLGSALSCAYQNCCIASKELEGIYPINSCNLSTGVGLLVLKAAQMIEAGETAENIQKEVSRLTPKVHSSFVLDTLDFLKAGGRCSALTSFGAGLFKIKPCIEVDNSSGSMKVGKKYRGELYKVINNYADNKLENLDKISDERIFIVHSGISPEILDSVYNKIKNKNYFKEIHITKASCTISSHCGPNALGIMFMSK